MVHSFKIDDATCSGTVQKTGAQVLDECLQTSRGSGIFAVRTCADGVVTETQYSDSACMTETSNAVEYQKADGTCQRQPSDGPYYKATCDNLLSDGKMAKYKVYSAEGCAADDEKPDFGNWFLDMECHPAAKD